MRSSCLASAFVFLAISLPVGAQGQGIDPAVDKQLTDTERQEYRSRVSQANSDAQRNQITEQYRKTVENRARSGGDGTSTQRQKQHAGGPGNGSAAASRPGPSGSKSKPQKSGR